MNSKNNWSLCLVLSTLILSGCVGKNSFEDAIDPESGSRQKWAKWSDEGGLNKINDFYGIKIQEVNVSWRKDRVQSMDMRAPGAYAPKDVRHAMAKICGGNDSDWKIQDGFGVQMGLLETVTSKCRYMSDGSGRWELVFLRK